MGTEMCAVSDIPLDWDHTDLKKARKYVRKLQRRIALAYKNDEIDKAITLQHKLIHSFYAKVLAVKIVTTNRGSNTPGIDNVIWLTSAEKMEAVYSLRRRGYKPKPLRRVYLPKSGGRWRPLSIPTFKDRAMQTLYKFALEPIAEVTADKGSYGFRVKHSARDALAECVRIFSKSPYPKWILKADIKSCFDNISHEWILDHIPMDKVILRKFLKCGYVEHDMFYPTERGIPQGGSLSSVICNMTLDGMEDLLMRECGADVRLVRYADDFIITATSQTTLVQSVVPVIEKFLSERGLHLSSDKTVITHIEKGFAFLGWQIYKERRHIITVPSRRSIDSLLQKVMAVSSDPLYDSGEKMYEPLKSIVRGWMNYYQGIAIKQSLYGVEFETVSCLNNITGDNKIAEAIGALFALYDNQ